MKTIKFLLVAMLLMVCGSEASAQNVVVYKKDGTKVEYQASQVKSVKYEKRYYYYVGWECPTSLSELANKVASADNVHSYGITKTTNIGFNSYNPFASMPTTITDKPWVMEHGEKRYNYIIVPSGMKLWDADDITVEISGVTFFKDTTVEQIPNHDIYKSENKLLACAKIAVY